MSQQINLFNPVFRQQKKYLSAQTMAQALGLVLIGALLLAGYAAYRQVSLKHEALAVGDQLRNAEAQLTKLNAEFPPKQKNAALEAEIAKADAELQSLEKIAGLLQSGDLGNTKGYAAYMRAFARQIIDGVWLTGFHIQGAGTEIGLQGRALNPELVPAYIARLKNEAVLQGKSFSTLEMAVPQVTAEGATGAAAATLVPANYIAFNLRSQGVPGAGAK